MSLLLVGKSPNGEVNLRLDRANRHGIIAGATGTGKTVTLQTLAEGFSNAGVPVFAADIKGDLSGVSMPGQPSEKLIAKVAENGFVIEPAASPAIFWDLLGAQGHPVRTTISELGPVMLSRLLELSEAQEGILTIAFTAADKHGWPILDLDDLQAVLKDMAERDKDYSAEFGNVTDASVATIQRKLLALRAQDADKFFAEPALDISDIMRTSGEKGIVSLLDATKLIEQPLLYSTFLLWLLSELYEDLPEVGDPEKPKLVFFFDEAHLLFRDAPKALLQKIEQVVRLIRSKGVGIYFITQNPADIPDSVLAQLGNRIQHALRAYTPSEQKGLKAAAQSFRPNPAFDTAEAIQGLGVGEALVSVLDEKGAPTVTAQTKIRPPNGRMGPLLPNERAALMAQSPVRGVYDTPENRQSAYEMLAAKAAAKAEAMQAPPVTQTTAPRGEPAPRAPRASTRPSMIESVTTSVIRAAGTQVARSITRELLRGVLGGLAGGSTRRRR